MDRRDWTFALYLGVCIALGLVGIVFRLNGTVEGVWWLDGVIAAAFVLLLLWIDREF